MEKQLLEILPCPDADSPDLVTLRGRIRDWPPIGGSPVVLGPRVGGGGESKSEMCAARNQIAKKSFKFVVSLNLIKTLEMYATAAIRS